MRKSVLLIMMLFAVSMAANAQKFALIDTEYIMKNIPAAQSANEQMQEATGTCEVSILDKKQLVAMLYCSQAMGNNNNGFFS